MLVSINLRLHIKNRKKDKNNTVIDGAIIDLKILYMYTCALAIFEPK